jgi:plasmid stabilization system protein ParE
MSLNYLISPAARDDIDDAYTWYEPDRIRVIAVLHAAADPRKWQRRR